MRNDARVSMLSSTLRNRLWWRGRRASRTPRYYLDKKSPSVKHRSGSYKTSGSGTSSHVGQLAGLHLYVSASCSKARVSHLLFRIAQFVASRWVRLAAVAVALRKDLHVARLYPCAAMARRVELGASANTSCIIGQRSRLVVPLNLEPT